MAILATYTPQGRNPDYGTGEMNMVHLFGDGTEVIASRGTGFISAIKVGVSPGAGGFVKFYDVGPGETAGPTNLIIGIDTSTVANGDTHDLCGSFSNGLTVIVNGVGSSLEVTGKWGRTTRTILRTLPRQVV